MDAEQGAETATGAALDETVVVGNSAQTQLGWLAWFDADVVWSSDTEQQQSRGERSG
jgi:hypothetical protein